MHSHLISTWDDTLLKPGEEWDETITAELQYADVIFLLVSHHFLSTKYIRDTELRIAINRYQKKECLVIPIIINSCKWEDVEILHNLHVIPRKGFNIASWKNNPRWQSRNDAWVQVYEEVKKTIDNFRPR